MTGKSEWTLAAGFVAALLDWLVGFQWDSLSAGQAAAIMTAINAVAMLVAAWRTRPVAPQVFTYAVASLAALAVAYGMHFSQESVGQFTAVLLAALAFIGRAQTSPVEDAPYTGVLGSKVP